MFESLSYIVIAVVCFAGGAYWYRYTLIKNPAKLASIMSRADIIEQKARSIAKQVADKATNLKK